MNCRIIYKYFTGHRIFWKIFVSFWLANLVIMLATTYVLLHHSEAEHFREEYQRGVSLVAEHLLAVDTQNGHSLRDTRRILRRMIRGPKNQEFIIRIYENGDLIVKFESSPNLPEPQFIFDLILADGRQVQVQTLEPRLPKMLLDIVHKVHKLHLFFMLLVSAVVSIFLSWSITRPLESLGRITRKFAADQVVDIEPKLLSRADEVGQLARDLDKMMRTLTQTLQSQQQLLHDVSHELRAPLARLQVAAELIQQKDQIPNPNILRIHEECARINQLIQRILNFSRLEQTSKPEIFELQVLIKKLLVNIQYENPNQEFRVEVSADSIPIFACQDLLEQGVENVLRNACKYSPRNGVIDVTLARDHGFAELMIRDHGPGVAEQDLEKLQIPFYRAGEQIHSSGYGLGLSIAHRAVVASGGTLLFANHRGGGLQVKIKVPAHVRIGYNQ